MNVPDGYRELMEAVESLQAGARRVVFLGVYPGRTEIRTTDGGPVAIYANGGDSGLTSVYLDKKAPPEGWRIGQGLSEDDLRRAAERLSCKP
ncbi:MAG: hypothetical protein HYT73_01530 [Candidatus Aenigmarchaeota archaeon]|nr:hypothetical protein [Candidatus Aenigmarchaeota archaeon]